MQLAFEKALKANSETKIVNSNPPNKHGVKSGTIDPLGRKMYGYHTVGVV